MSYRTARAAWEARREACTLGYLGGEEEAAFREADPPPTFRAWLLHRDPAAQAA